MREVATMKIITVVLIVVVILHHVVVAGCTTNSIIVPPRPHYLSSSSAFTMHHACSIISPCWYVGVMPVSTMLVFDRSLMEMHSFSTSVYSTTNRSWVFNVPPFMRRVQISRQTRTSGSTCHSYVGFERYEVSIVRYRIMIRSIIDTFTYSIY